MHEPGPLHGSCRRLAIDRPQLWLPSRQLHQPDQLGAAQLFLQPVSDHGEAGGGVQPAGPDRTAARGAVAVAAPPSAARHRLPGDRECQSRRGFVLSSAGENRGREVRGCRATRGLAPAAIRQGRQLWGCHQKRGTVNDAGMTSLWSGLWSGHWSLVFGLVPGLWSLLSVKAGLLSTDTPLLG